MVPTTEVRKRAFTALRQHSVRALAFLATTGTSCAAQDALPEVGALIDESKVQSTLYVAQANKAASDSSTGLKDKPFRTISAAMKLALGNLEKGVATKVVIAPGTYREVLPAVDGDKRNATFRNTLLVIEGQKPAKGQQGVVISGADVVKK